MPKALILNHFCRLKELLLWDYSAGTHMSHLSKKNCLPENFLFHNLTGPSKKMDPPIVLPARFFCTMLSLESHHITDSSSVHINGSLVIEDYPLLLFHRTYNEFPTFRRTCLSLFPNRGLSSSFVVGSKSPSQGIELVASHEIGLQGS